MIVTEEVEEYELDRNMNIVRYATIDTARIGNRKFTTLGAIKSMTSTDSTHIKPRQ